MNSPYIKSVLVHSALKFVHPLIRETLFEDTDFRKDYGLKDNGVLSFNEVGFSIRRSDLFEAVRKVTSGLSPLEITDIAGQQWVLKNINEDGELPRLTLSRDEQHLALPDLSPFSTDSAVRLQALNKVVSDVNLPTDIADKWRNILIERALEDDEIDEFINEFSATPIYRARSMGEDIQYGGIEISSLVPLSRKYFERLVGVYDGSTSIVEYAARNAKAFFNQMIKWRSHDGFLLGLLLASHSSITTEINIDLLNNEELVRAFEFLDKHGDRISQLGAIEVGLRILPVKPEIESLIISLVKQIRDDDVNGQRSGFTLLSALFILVDGELSRTRLLSTEPPFYRRLASLSQAALIHRELANSIGDTNHFYQWATSSDGEQFYMQSFTDMRLEPSWNPDFATPSQIKADFFGRIIFAAKAYEENIKDSELFDLILTNKPGSLYSLDSSLHPFLPGPLEGSNLLQRSLPDEIAELIKMQLSAQEIEPLSFIALVNSALIYRVGTEQAELVIRALKLGNYRLAKVENKEQLVAILYGLAMVAGATRNSTLADELRILVRRYMRDPEYALAVGEVLRICLIASASHADLNDWRDFAGDWLTELAFSELDGNDGKIFLSRLTYLLHAVPELWVSCGRAEAALMAYNASMYLAT